ncbi:MAG: NAD(P)H-hydrate dehydratase [Anaerolineales bacterium]
MKLVTVAEMISIEREANAQGLTYETMMENAGRGLAETILEEYCDSKDGGILGLVGSGNNGGDTLVALSYLAEKGWQASAYIVRPRPADDVLMQRLIRAGGVIHEIGEDKNLSGLIKTMQDHAILLDGVLGTGIRLPLKPNLAEILDFIRIEIQNEPKPPIVVAVDCPSGVDCDSGETAPECIPANLTVTMAAIKSGLMKFPAFNLLGDLRVIGIGLPDEGKGLVTWKAVNCIVPEFEWVRQYMPPRPLDAHKGTFGTLLVVAGSINYTGAALLAGQAAFRSGAGLVTLAIPAPLHTSLSGQFPEATWLPLPHEGGVIASEASDIVLSNLERATALLVGPGFGLEGTTGEFLSRLLDVNIGLNSKLDAKKSNASTSSDYKAKLPPLVIDADGLKLLAKIPSWWSYLPKQTVLTPHPGEMSVLTGLSTQDIQSDRLDIARDFSRKWGHILVLKGAFTVISAPDSQAAVIPVATPALARAGTGDVLSGLIAGLRAQGVDGFQAAVAGAWIHAQAGLLAAETIGNSASVLAGDVCDASVDVISALYNPN